MKRYRELYRAEQLPVCQNRIFHFKKDAINCTKGNVVIVQDLKTGLIFNQAFSPELIQYAVDYQNEQALSIVFQKHLKKVAEILQHHFWNQSLIEVGCGKGYFLEQLQGLGFDIKGLDPAYEGSNPSVIKEYFAPKIRLRADGIILRHVLEHVQNPIGFLLNLRDTNGGIGKVYIEVPCFDWICTRRAWFDIFYEHVNYFRLRDFNRMFARVYESGHTFGGQYLYAVADLATIKIPTYEAQDCFEFPNDFLATVTQYATRLKTQDIEQKTAFSIWGGASKGVIFAFFMQRAGAKIDMVIDINPAKQNKYLAATGLKVQSPAEAMQRLTPGADLFVMNSNYLNEIQDLTANQFNLLLVEHERI